MSTIQAQGANGYLVKPGRLEDMVTMAKSIRDYWLQQNRTITWTQVGARKVE